MLAQVPEPPQAGVLGLLGAIIAGTLMGAPAADPGFLRSSDLFEHQPEAVLGAVLAQGSFVDLGPGGVLFRQGDQGDRLYIVKKGVLEILAAPADGSEPAPVAYLGPGEVLGELALLTGSPRSATARCPEQAVLFCLDKAVFLDLMSTLPAFSRNLCVVLAKRLEATTSRVPRGTVKQLQGNLRFFDLATVIQTLIGSSQTGNLVVTQQGGTQRIADLLFFKGNIARAKVKHLSGDDAVFQLFQIPLEGDFSFTGRTVSEEDLHTDVTMPAISLLMESVRLQDELPMLKERVPDPDRVYRQKAAQLNWSDPESLELTVAVWSRLKRGASIHDLHRDIPRCSHALYGALVGLLNAGLVE